jgi:predicted Zn-dependent protease
VAVVGLAAVAAVVAWRAGDGADREAALAACRNRPFDEAEPLLKAALARHPDDPDVLDCLARGYVKADRPREAEPLLTRLINLRPDNAGYLRLRMELYRQLKQWERAYADTRRLLELEPGDDKLRQAAMGQALEAGAFAEAEEYCRKLLRDAPSDRGLRLWLARIRRARGDDPGAAALLDELIREDPFDYGAVLARGTLYDEAGESDNAVPLLRRVFDQDPTRRRTSGYQLALALTKVGQKAEADKILAEVRRLQDVELAQDAIRNQPDNLDLQVRLAESLLRDGHTADGMKLLEQVLARSPRFAPAHRVLADQYAREGRANLADQHRRLAGPTP